MENNQEPPTDEFGNPIHPVEEIARGEKQDYIIQRGMGRLLFGGIVLVAAMIAFPYVVIPLVVIAGMILISKNL